MNEIMSQKAASLFDDIGKWNAFLELYNLKDRIIDQWNSRLIEALEKTIVFDVDKWKFRKWQSKSWGWHTGEDPGSLVILYENNNFCLWIDGARYDTNQIVDTFREQKIFSGFFRPSEILKNNSYLAIRKNAISIHNLTNPDLLAWHAGKDTSESKLLYDELHRFFSFFMLDPEIYGMILDINKVLR